MKILVEKCFLQFFACLCKLLLKSVFAVFACLYKLLLKRFFAVLNKWLLKRVFLQFFMPRCSWFSLIEVKNCISVVSEVAEF
jgi:hypothetical protein